jgi:hypothetical protein
MSVPEILQLVDLVRDRAAEGTFLSWFCRHSRNILHPDVNPPIISQSSAGRIHSEPVFDDQINRLEQRQIQVFQNTLRPEADPEVALSFPQFLETSHIEYFDRQRIRLQRLVNRWSSAFVTAAPHSERFQRSLFDRIAGYGSGDSWNFLASREYLPFYYVMMLPPAPYGIEIQIPPIMSLHPDQFLRRTPPHNRSMRRLMRQID